MKRSVSPVENAKKCAHECGGPEQFSKERKRDRVHFMYELRGELPEKRTEAIIGNTWDI